MIAPCIRLHLTLNIVGQIGNIIVAVILKLAWVLDVLVEFEIRSIVLHIVSINQESMRAKSSLLDNTHCMEELDPSLIQVSLPS